MPSWLTFERVLLVVLAATVLVEAQSIRDQRRMLDKIGEAVVADQSTCQAMNEALEGVKARIDALPTPVCAPAAAAGAWGGAPGAAGVERARAGGAAGASATDPASPEALAAGGRTSSRARRFANMPANVLSRMYDAADRMAEDEGWDDATYDQVAGIFEASAGRAVELFGELQAGTLTPVDARDQAMALRDEVTGKLEGVIGADGVTRLKGYLAGKDLAPR
jgi:hypothetical protein